jgi:hypothetical protein
MGFGHYQPINISTRRGPRQDKQALGHMTPASETRERDPAQKLARGKDASQPNN